MRQVNWEPQQRVDQPDAQALSTFAAMENRRLVRLLFAGSDAANDIGRILNGFKVVPEDPGVSPRVRVMLDNGGENFSAISGAIDHGLAEVDWGQIGGGNDGLGNLEGSSQNLLDFSGQPAATYTVKLKLSFVKGAQDNRAFWNPAGNIEFIKPTNTRWLPQWELAYTGHADPEWVTLATVVWGGSDVDTADIDDRRVFPMEGAPRPSVASAARWSHEAQDDGDTLGVGDFDRSEDRGAAAATLQGVWSMMRALGRQVQDLKGGRESDMRFDWFSRVYPTAGALAANPTEKRTKSLRTTDIVTYTVADGTTEQGDFNGEEGLYDCLKFIEDNAADLPGRLHIVVKQRGTSVIGTPYTMPLPVTITGKAVSIVGLGNPSVAAPTGSGYWTGQIVVGPGSFVGPGAVINLEGGAELSLDNIFMNGGFDNGNCLWIEGDLTSRLQARNSVIGNDEDTDSDAIRVASQGLRLERTYIVGTAWIGGRANEFGMDDITEAYSLWGDAGVVENCVFSGFVKLRHANVPTLRAQFASGLVFERCLFFHRVEYVSPGLADPEGQIDVTGAQHVWFDKCEMAWHGSQDCIRGVNFDFGSFEDAPVRDLHVTGCRFRLAKTAIHNNLAGVNGTEGTGWAIQIRSKSLLVAATRENQLPRNIQIIGNTFSSGNELLDTGTVCGSPQDAGCVSVVDAAGCVIRDNTVRDWSSATVTSGASLRQLFYGATVSTGVAIAGHDYRIESNYFDRFFSGTPGGGGVPSLVCMSLKSLTRPHVAHNDFSASFQTGSFQFGDDGCALKLEALAGGIVSHNTFSRCRRNLDADEANWSIQIHGITFGLGFDHNHFKDCGGANIYAASSSAHAGLRFMNNFFELPTSGSNWSSAISIEDASLVGHASFVGNAWDRTSGTALKLGGLLVGVIMSNQFYGGDIEHDSLGGSPSANLRGYAEAGQDLNLVASYT